tara:strand:- start:197 stop:703 length:507 start_codon:yes stop_codon:yes gene_type:complete
MSVISHLVAMAKNRVIGVNNDLPWNLPDDLNHFKQYTLNKPIVMGRKTFESIGKPLPQRINIVISRSLSEIEGVNVFSEVEDGIAFANQYNEEHQLEDEVIIIGGAQIFNETLPMMNRLVLTQVDCEIAGDVFYPEIDMHNFSRKNVSRHLKNEKNQFDFSIDLYEKI